MSQLSMNLSTIFWINRLIALSLEIVSISVSQKLKMTSSSVLFHRQPKEIQLTVTEEESSQRIFTSKKLESENFFNRFERAKNAACVQPPREAAHTRWRNLNPRLIWVFDGWLIRLYWFLSVIFSWSTARLRSSSDGVFTDSLVWILETRVVYLFYWKTDCATSCSTVCVK